MPEQAEGQLLEFLFGEYKKQLLHSGLWAIHAIEVVPRRLQISGWAVPPYGDRIPFEIRVNGHPFTSADYARPHPVATAFRLGERPIGFVCALEHEVIERERDYVFTFENLYTGVPFDERQTFVYRGLDLPLPETSRLNRVHGPDPCSFELFGATFFRALRDTLRVCFGRDLGDFERVLDWGCGCGRVTRFFRDFAQGERRAGTSWLWGMDIDADNVAWCRENLPFARFITTSLEPPAPVDDEAFDLVFGISVFTHLSRDSERKWLGELRRITRRGGVVLMTVRGDVAGSWFAWRNGPPEFGGFTVEELYDWKIQNRGFLDCGLCNALGDQLKEVTYWRNVMHAREYVVDTWSDEFDIVDIIPGRIFGQDLVVMRRP